jgi:hypothetical protein
MCTRCASNGSRLSRENPSISSQFRLVSPIASIASFGEKDSTIPGKPTPQGSTLKSTGGSIGEPEVNGCRAEKKKSQSRESRRGPLAPANGSAVGVGNSGTTGHNGTGTDTVDVEPWEIFEGDGSRGGFRGGPLTAHDLPAC